MMPEAPVRFSTMNCCLSESDSFAANRRASGSTEPPGGYGETNLTTLVGHSWAWTAQEKTRHRNRVMSLEADIASSFEFQHFARFVRRRDGEAELLEDAARFGNLVCVRLRELAAADPEAVFQPDADVAAHDRRLR